jgi:hypothetical protein
MRTLGLVAVITFGCGGAQKPKDKTDVIVVERTTEETCAPPVADDTRRASHRAEIARELEAIDRELDQIDEELAAGVVPVPASRDAALAALTSRISLLQRTAPEALFADTPPLLIRIANEYGIARDRDAELGVSYGERHPTRIEQRRIIDALRVAFDRQREVELARATSSREQLAALPKGAPATKLRQADLRALQQTLSRFAIDAVVPSDAPTDVRIAALRVAEARRKIEAAEPSLGPKHPDMVELQTALGAARDRMQKAATSAEATLARAIAALEAHRATPKSDPARLARRAELAARARDLRREWDALR